MRIRRLGFRLNDAQPAKRVFPGNSQHDIAQAHPTRTGPQVAHGCGLGLGNQFRPAFIKQHLIPEAERRPVAV